MISLLSPADVISIINALFGFLSLIVLSLQSIDQNLAFRLSFIFILLALLADGLDGVIARRTKKGSMGPYLESMADMTSTGIAVSFFVFLRYQSQLQSEYLVVQFVFIACIVIYLFCDIVRLAAFHPLKTTDSFIGLPAPAAAIIILCSAVIPLSFLSMIMLLILMAGLMVSSIHYLKPSIKLNSLTAMLIFLVIMFGSLIGNLFIWMLIGLIGLYIILGPLKIQKVLFKD